MDPNNPADPNNPTPTQNDPAPEPQGTPAPSPGSSGDKLVMLPPRAFQQRIKSATESGRKAALAELDRQAQAKGFANHAAMMTHLDSMLAAPKAKPASQSGEQSGSRQAPVSKQDRKAMARTEQEIARERRAREQAETAARDERKRRQMAERRADAVEAKANLERIASNVGIKDTEYAIHLFNRHHRGMAVEQLEKVDEEAFFKGLRQTHGHLFGEQVVPMTTGTTGTPPILPPGPQGKKAGEKDEIDVRKMSKPEYDAYLRKQGLTQNASGLG